MQNLLGKISELYDKAATFLGMPDISVSVDEVAAMPQPTVSHAMMHMMIVFILFINTVFYLVLKRL